MYNTLFPFKAVTKVATGVEVPAIHFNLTDCMHKNYIAELTFRHL